MAVSLAYNLFVRVFGGDSNTAFYLSFAAFGILYVFGSIIQKKLFSKDVKYGAALLLVIPAFLLFIPEQSISNANSTDFKYWHTANNDVIESFCGANSILNNTKSPIKVSEQNRIREDSDPDPKLSYFSESWKCSNSANVYLNDLSSLQYSNISLFARFSNSIPSFSTYLAQSILNVVLLVFGLLLLGQRQFNFSKKVNLLFVTSVLFSHLFFVTFLNGHIGTLMIAAPLVTILTLSIEKISASFKHFSIVGICFAFISLAYPYILPFTLILFGFVWLYGKHRKLFNYSVFIFSICFPLFTWVYFAEERFKASTAFRSWGSFLTPMAPLQYFGLLPGNIMGSKYLGVAQAFTQSIGINSPRDFALASILALIPFWFVIYKAFRNNVITQIKLILILVVFFSLDVAIASQDPYFFYKVSYVFQFIVLAFVISGLVGTKQFFGERHKYRSLVMLALKGYFLVILGLNIFFNTISVVEMLNRNSQLTLAATEVSNFPNDKISNSISLIEEGADDFVTYYLVSLVRGPAIVDNDEPIYEFNVEKDRSKRSNYTLEKMPLDTLKISNAGIYSTEVVANSRFRWVAGIRESIDSDWSQIRILRLNSSNKPRIVEFCGKLAEFGKIEIMPFRVTTSLGETVVNSGQLTKKSECFEFVMPAEAIFFKIETEGSAEYASLFDRRRLLYKLERLEVVQ